MPRRHQDEERALREWLEFEKQKRELLKKIAENLERQ